MAKKAKHFIQKAIGGDKGALHRALGIPQGQKIPQDELKKAAAEPGKIGKEARLAETLEGFHKKRDGKAPK
jgi:hypothetical protein